MPKEWTWSTMVQLYKNKDDIQNHNNYRCIKLLSHIRKVWERVVQMRVKRMTILIDMARNGVNTRLEL
ncbi:hypothetical protein H5410_060122 [Solanum commersonii]|uniref:Uncharacterized protein n=1 Tax=Solanum commersonii TaxID=4109 RepID=A0A9J5W519_SOLCO|nr:hypothetical protein H5410_060122 [Solanum commersonii]